MNRHFFPKWDWSEFWVGFWQGVLIVPVVVEAIRYFRNRGA